VDPDPPDRPGSPVGLATIARQWGRIGCLGFGGPPTHIAMLRRLCVDDRGWILAEDFEHGIAATNVLPGPASTQLAIYCAWRLRRTAGAVVGGLAFILPGLVAIIALAVLFLQAHPARWVEGLAAGAGAAVAAVAVRAGAGLVPSSWQRTATGTGARARWALYVVAGGAAATLLGPYLVLVLLTCGTAEVLARRPPPVLATWPGPVLLLAAAGSVGGLWALVWVALKVGALSFGGGFVIVPLMQADAVHHYHWMTGSQFLDAVALGQITPGPVVQTVAVVGYAAAGVGGAILAAGVAFAPSFAFILAGGPHFDRLRRRPGVQAFLAGVGPAAIGAILGSAIPLGLALTHVWQVPVLALAGLWLLALRREVVVALVGAGLIGLAVALAGGPVGG
jgi:chromate transporter